jgi:chromosomal replication initiator protein
MNEIDKEQLWKEVLKGIESFVSRASLNTWFQDTSISKIKDDGIVVLTVPNSFAKEWLENKYHHLIVKSLRDKLSDLKTVEYTISTQQPVLTYRKPVIRKITSLSRKKEEDLQLSFDEFEEETSLNPKYTFDNFVVGAFNELANAASLAVIKNLGTLYNPLFIYGGVGLGKTHLLQATGNKVKSENRKIRIKYTTSDKFSNELIDSIQNNTVQGFKEPYKNCDLLIIDDVQFLSGKQKTQEELFHIFNTLYEKNKQIIFSSDRPPKSIPALEERLRSRFEGGMMADISEPEYEARIAILKTKASLKNIVLTDEVFEYIASTITSNIRELEGALNILSAKIRLLGKIPTFSEIKEIINKNTKGRQRVTFNKIIKSVASFYEIKEEMLFEKTRKKEHVLPRQIAMYLLREDFNASYPYIGQKLGGRDHSTVIYAYEKISKDLKKKSKIKEEIKKIRENIYQLGTN